MLVQAALRPSQRAPMAAIASVGWLYRRIEAELATRRRDVRTGVIAQVHPRAFPVRRHR
jgi:hypothetical protein